jgi:hypothetical protein
MAKHQKKQQNTLQTNDKRSKEKGRGHQNSRFRHSNVVKKQDPDDVPILN